MTPTAGWAVKLQVVAMTVVVVLGVLWVVDSGRLGPRELVIPPVGEVTAEWLDGHPVFVVHAEPGEVLVLDAVSTHDQRPEGAGKVLAWCTTAGSFEDAWHGSRFDPQGDWVGGPAPTGMARFDVEVSDGRVLVGDRLPAPPRPEPGGGPRTFGPSCTDGGGEPDLEALVMHDPAGGDDPSLVYPATDLAGDDPAR